MLLMFYFLYCISLSSAVDNLQDIFPNPLDELIYDDDSGRRAIKQTLPSGGSDFKPKTPHCETYADTSRTPFVVLVLHKTAGRFLGMGSIVDQNNVLTAHKVVLNTFHTPSDIIILAGRLITWWGKNSQVRFADYVAANEAGLALVRVAEPFHFNKYVAPIRIETKMLEVKTAYTIHFATFGIVRTAWDIPGDEVSKTSMYTMAIETTVLDKDVDACKKHFPEKDWDESKELCTYANTSYLWGCIGSPTIAVDEKDVIKQIAVIVHTDSGEKDVYHIHARVPLYISWLKGEGVVNFPE